MIQSFDCRLNRHPAPWLVLLLLMAGLAHASEYDNSWDNLQIHGFLTQGFVYTTDNSWFGDSESGSFEFTEVGINGSLRFHPRFLVSAQLLSRHAGEMYSGSPVLDYGLLDYNAIASDSLYAGVRLGRLKNPLGLYNDTRDVAATRPGIFLPQSIYFDRVRNLVLSSDGGQIYGEWFTAHGNWHFQANYGNLLVDKNVEYAFLGRDWDGDLDSGDPALFSRLLYETPDGALRLAFSYTDVQMKFERGPTDPLADGKIEVDLWVVSAEYSTERWSLTGELNQEDVKWRRFGPFFQVKPTTTLGYYLQGTWRFDHQWQGFVRYDALFLDKNDKNGKDAEERTGNPAHTTFAKDWTVGVRWDFRSGWMARAEFHHVDGAAWLSPRENNMANTEEDWNMFSLLISYSF